MVHSLRAEDLFLMGVSIDGSCKYPSFRLPWEHHDYSCSYSVKKRVTDLRRKIINSDDSVLQCFKRNNKFYASEIREMLGMSRYWTEVTRSGSIKHGTEHFTPMNHEDEERYDLWRKGFIEYRRLHRV